MPRGPRDSIAIPGSGRRRAVVLEPTEAHPGPDLVRDAGEYVKIGSVADEVAAWLQAVIPRTVRLGPRRDEAYVQQPDRSPIPAVDEKAILH